MEREVLRRGGKEMDGERGPLGEGGKRWMGREVL